MWDWAFDKSPPRDAKNEKLLAQENRRLRRFNAQLLDKLRDREEAVNAMKEAAAAQARCILILEKEVALAKEASEGLAVQLRRNFTDPLRDDHTHCTTRDNTTHSLELLASQAISTMLCAEHESWRTILRMAQIMTPEDTSTEKPTLIVPLHPTTKPYTVILDIDETQVHFCLESYPIPKAELRFRAGLEPALKRLSKLKDKIDLGIWTAGVPRYARAARDLISMIAREGNLFDWTLARDVSWVQKGGVKKDLTALGRDVEKVLLIDNARKVVVQKENTLIVTNFYSSMRGDHADDTLVIVSELVEELAASTFTVPQFLRMKSEEGSILCVGGYYYAPTTWSSEIVKLRKERRQPAPPPDTLSQLADRMGEIVRNEES